MYGDRCAQAWYWAKGVHALTMGCIASLAGQGQFLIKREPVPGSRWKQCVFEVATESPPSPGVRRTCVRGLAFPEAWQFRKGIQSKECVWDQSAAVGSGVVHKWRTPMILQVDEVLSHTGPRNQCQTKIPKPHILGTEP